MGVEGGARVVRGVSLTACDLTHVFHYFATLLLLGLARFLTFPRPDPADCDCPTGGVAVGTSDTPCGATGRPSVRSVEGQACNRWRGDVRRGRGAALPDVARELLEAPRVVVKRLRLDGNVRSRVQPPGSVALAARL